MQIFMYTNITHMAIFYLSSIEVSDVNHFPYIKYLVHSQLALICFLPFLNPFIHKGGKLLMLGANMPPDTTCNMDLFWGFVSLGESPIQLLMKSVVRLLLTLIGERLGSCADSFAKQRYLEKRT